MSEKVRVDMIWWVHVTASDFFYVEKASSSDAGGGEQTYFIVPKNLVAKTFQFLDFVGDYGSFVPVTIQAAAVGYPGTTAPLQFQVKSGGRLRISHQNRQRDPNLRHPAWSSERGFPKAPDDVANSREAGRYMPRGGLRLFLIKALSGGITAGFTKGAAPPDLATKDPNRLLYGSGSGGLIHALGGSR